MYHGFSKDFDLFAKYGKITEKIGADGKKHIWIEIERYYKRKKGVFEYIIDEDMTINYRYFKVKE